MKKALCMILVLLAACCSQKKQAAYIDGEEITVSGIVTVIGNEPFTKIAIRPSDGRAVIILPADFKKSSSGIIGRTVTFRGKVSVKELVSASGKYRSFEYRFADAVAVEK